MIKATNSGKYTRISLKLYSICSLADCLICIFTDGLYRGEIGAKYLCSELSEYLENKDIKLNKRGIK